MDLQKHFEQTISQTLRENSQWSGDADHLWSKVSAELNEPHSQGFWTRFRLGSMAAAVLFFLILQLSGSPELPDVPVETEAPMALEQPLLFMDTRSVRKQHVADVQVDVPSAVSRDQVVPIEIRIHHHEVGAFSIEGRATVILLETGEEVWQFLLHSETDIMHGGGEMIFRLSMAPLTIAGQYQIHFHAETSAGALQSTRRFTVEPN